jgi:hypothetical protein
MRRTFCVSEISWAISKRDIKLLRAGPAQLANFPAPTLRDRRHLAPDLRPQTTGHTLKAALTSSLSRDAMDRSPTPPARSSFGAASHVPYVPYTNLHSPRPSTSYVTKNTPLSPTWAGDVTPPGRPTSPSRHHRRTHSAPRPVKVPPSFPSLWLTGRKR